MNDREMVLLYVAGIFDLNEGAKSLVDNALKYLSRSNTSLDQVRARDCLVMAVGDRYKEIGPETFELRRENGTGFRFHHTRHEKTTTWVVDVIFSRNGSSTSVSWEE